MEIKDQSIKLSSQINAVYFIGIGGIGMSAIARYFISRGLVVGGYDKTPSPLTRQLEREGALIHHPVLMQAEDHVPRGLHPCHFPRTSGTGVFP